MRQSFNPREITPEEANCIDGENPEESTLDSFSLDLLTIGMVNDMYAESGNDDYKGYREIAAQKDMDLF